MIDEKLRIQWLRNKEVEKVKKVKKEIREVRTG